ncbi:MAG TPA: hypothetical protein VHG72_04050 [Polyangia bacterium]|nr:hypothetical protein [Polyangia bacterium]
MRVATVRILAAALTAACFERRAVAYPQFQFSSGTTRCSQCHYSPAGGGLITSWGRDQAGDTISLGGDGSFAHGAVALPSWLALGVDLRMAATRNDVGGPESPEYDVFPMQADLYSRVAFSDQLSLYVEGGVRGDTGREESVNSQFESVVDRLISNEHYLMWRQGGTGAYVRLGRFFAPFGLRFAEHIFYVQRYTGYDLYNETYTLSCGYIGDDTEIHLSAFVPPPESFPNPLQSVGVRESGGAAYGEHRFSGMAALALQARLGVGPEATRYEGGAVGKLWLDQAKVLVLGEADFIRQQIKAAAAGENQFVSFVGPTFFPTHGLMAGVAYERYQEDLAVAATAHNAFDLEVNLFPWAHLELLALARYQFFGSAARSDGASASLYMLQIHYYL